MRMCVCQGETCKGMSVLWSVEEGVRGEVLG